MLRHHVDEFIGDHIGIEVVEPDPMEVQLTQLAQQLGQHGLLIKIHAVTGDILRNDNEFLHPSVGELLRLRQQRLHAAAAIMAAQIGDNAEGAVVVAPLCDLQVGAPGHGGHQPLTVVIGVADITKALRRLAAHDGFNGGDHLIIASGTQHPVHFRQLGTDILPIALGQAAGHQDLLQLSGVFQTGQFKDMVNGLALGRVDKAAGVQNADIRALRVRDDRVSRFPHQRGHLLRIHQIFCAAQRNEGYSIIAQRDSSSIFAP